MPRKPRELVDSGLYHVINRGNNKMQIFRDADDFRHYLRLLRRYKSLFNFKLYAFCIMPNHIHLLLETISREKGISRIMHRLNIAYSIWFQLRYQWKGHVWQGPFHSFLIEKEQHLYACARYIELNPCRAGLVANPSEYPWSSLREHLLPRDSGLINRQEMYNILSLEPTENFIRAYSELIQSGMGNKSKALWD